MKFIVDTADLNEICEASSWGLVDGVATNPSLMSKAGWPYPEVLREIREAVDGPNGPTSWRPRHRPARDKASHAR